MVIPFPQRVAVKVTHQRLLQRDRFRIGLLLSQPLDGVEVRGFFGGIEPKKTPTAAKYRGTKAKMIGLTSVGHRSNFLKTTNLRPSLTVGHSHLAITPIKSQTRLEYPHSLSYQLRHLRYLLPVTLVNPASKIEE
jgi:hypothetical protein